MFIFDDSKLLYVLYVRHNLWGQNVKIKDSHIEHSSISNYIPISFNIFSSGKKFSLFFNQTIEKSIQLYFRFFLSTSVTEIRRLYNFFIV